MSFLLCKKFSFSKCAINRMCRRLERIIKPKAVVWSNVTQGKVENISSSSHIIARYPQRSHRHKYLHMFAVFGAVYSNTSSNNKNSNDNENVCLVDDTIEVTTPIPNRHKKCDSNGRFSKVTGKDKVVEPMRTSLAARRKLVFDKCNENEVNEPPTKRRTRSNEVQYNKDNITSWFVS